MCPGITKSFMLCSSAGSGPAAILMAVWQHKPRFESVLNHAELNHYPEITAKLKIAEDLARSVGRRKKEIHDIAINAWKMCFSRSRVIRALDLKISKLTVECENIKAEGKSLHKAQNREWTTCYLELSTEYFRRKYSEEELNTFLETKVVSNQTKTDFYKFCDEQFFSKFPEIDLNAWIKVRRQSSSKLRYFALMREALPKKGPQDPSSRQTGDLPTPSHHGLGLLAMAASNAANSLHMDVEPQKNSRSLDQLLQAMDPRQESDVPDSDNDGRGHGASEYLCSSDGHDPGKDPPSSGSGERPRQSAFACSGRSKGSLLRAQFKRSMIERYREIPELTDSGSEDEARLTRPLSATGGRRAAPRDSADARAAAAAGGGAAAATGAAGGDATAAPQSSVTESRGSAFPCRIGDGARSAAAGADAGGVGGAQAGGVGGAQASGTGGELTFTESLPLCLSRLTAARADWQPPPICQCRSID